MNWAGIGAAQLSCVCAAAQLENRCWAFEVFAFCADAAGGCRREKDNSGGG